ncbi:hypothetical protein QUF64_10765 [Anaerolineales bacterium HSG6]|nr:hypothetical protein [Anaerolineales bacterium HSG6]
MTIPNQKTDSTTTYPQATATTYPQANTTTYPQANTTTYPQANSLRVGKQTQPDSLQTLILQDLEGLNE